MAAHQSPAGSKRPRLSLQIQTSCDSSSSTVDAGDSTSFNTLSNAYVAAIQRSSSAFMSEPITAINTLQSFTLTTPAEYKDAKSRIVTPYIASFPETPLTAHPMSPSQLQFPLPSTMTATPPLSAEASYPATPTVFTFSSSDMPSSPARDRFAGSLVDGPTLRRRIVPYLSAALNSHLPYSHPRSLHSILRNSPLPPRTAIPPPSPRRQSLRLQEKAAKRVGYNSPLTQDIVTNKYTKSHIELLGEDVSPGSPCSPAELNKAMNMPLAFTASEVQDGGQTPSPFGDVRLTQAAGALSSAEPTGARKRKRTEKKRRWVWTIGQDDEDEAADETTTARPAEVDDAYAVDVSRLRYLETPTPSVESTGSTAESIDASMSDACSVDSSEGGLSELEAANVPELDPKTPVAPRQTGGRQRERQRDTPIPELCGKRDTPVPPELT